MAQWPTRSPVYHKPDGLRFAHPNTLKVRANQKYVVEAIITPAKTLTYVVLFLFCGTVDTPLTPPPPPQSRPYIPFLRPTDPSTYPRPSSSSFTLETLLSQILCSCNVFKFVAILRLPYFPIQLFGGLHKGGASCHFGMYTDCSWDFSQVANH